MAGGSLELSPKIKKKPNIKHGFKQWGEASIFIGIGLVLFVVFILYPQLKNIYMAFTEYSVMPGVPSKFVGLANFKRALIPDSADVMNESAKFWLAMRNSLLAVAVTVPGQMFFGLIIAVLINSVTRGKLIYRVLLYVPVITSWVIVSILFQYLFQDTNGSLVNYALLKMHLINEPIGWLQNQWTGNAVIWILSIWKGVGWVMLIYTAALQNMPSQLYEAAEIDGANSLQKFLKITVPLLKPTSVFLIINLVIGAFNIFISVMLITSGGPLGQTDVLLNYMYTRAFNYFEFGYASAVSILMGIVVIVITLLGNKILKFEDSTIQF